MSVSIWLGLLCVPSNSSEHHAPGENQGRIQRVSLGGRFQQYLAVKSLSELYKIMLKKVTFVGFRGDIAPIKSLVTSLHLIKARLFCKLELCVGLAAVSYNKNIVIFSRWLSNTVVMSAFVSRKARLVFLDVIFSTSIFFSTAIQKSDCYWVLEQVCTAPMLSKSEKILSLMSLNSKKKYLCQLATTDLFPNETGKHKKMIKARLGLMP